MSSRASGWLLPLVLALAGLLAGAADVWVNLEFAPLRRGDPTAVPSMFPVTARLDLLLVLVLLSMTGAVAIYDVRSSASAPRADLRLPLVLALVESALGATLLNPLEAVLVPVAFVLVVWAGPRLAGAHSREVVPMVTLALAARVLVAFGLGLYARSAHGGLTLLDDEESLHRAAIELGPILLGGFGDLQTAWRHLPSPYLSLLSAVYLVVGPDFTAIRLLNAAVASLGVGLVYGTVERLFGGRAARAAAWTVALWPGFVLWTSTGLRESVFTTVSLLIPWLLTRRVNRPAWVLLVATAGVGLLVVASLRNYAAGGIVAALAVALGRRRLLLAPLLLVLGVVAWPHLPIAQQVTARGIEYQAAALELSTIPETDPQKRPPPPAPDILSIASIVRAQLPGEDHLTTAVVYAFESDPFRYVVATDRDTLYVLPPERVLFISDETVTWDVPLARLGRGLRLLFLPPAPWGTESLQRLATIPDALAWDALVLLAGVSVWQQRRQRALAWGLSLVYLLLMIAALGIVSSNLGTAVRHRGMLVPWAAILSAPALVELVLRWEAPRLLRARTAPLT